MLPFVTALTFCQKQHQFIRDRIRSKKVTTKITLASTSDDVIIAVDVGTSATKVTQRPSNWLAATMAGCADAFQDTGHITAISVTGQMQDLIGHGRVPDLLDDRAILYSDARAVNEATRLANMTNTRVLPTDLLPKLALLPSPLGTDYKLMIGGADCICYELAGCPDRHFTDATTAATTGLTTEPHRTYNTGLFEQAHLAPFLPLLPEILPHPAVVGHLSPKTAQILGRPEAAGVPVIHAGGDAFSATVGAGCDDIGSGCYVYGGSSGWVGQTIRVEEKAGSGLALAHAADEKAVIVAGSVAAVGACVSHACEAFLNCNVNDLNRLASSSQIGASDVVYVPYITGRRCPAADAVGSLYGLKAGTKRQDIARAVIEGLVFALADASKGMNCEGVEIVGGVTASAVFVNGVKALFGGARLGERDVGVKGAGIVGARVLGLEITDLGKATYTSASGVEHQKWVEAFRRWKRVVSCMEDMWNS